ncbi:inactive pancreatic lipase-related protein 1-like [Saccostrea echinata]|uniref:inactive pancreatic lipase-related protein 1-like n=1 Tax=Saccostrea echinata TaxID=191078 RepID=UPI002A7FC309|nr:inactive pancreatic lipase-related protein 1-like [Saccostrea echinata]
MQALGFLVLGVTFGYSFGFFLDEQKKVCYGDLGCFAIDDPFDNTFGYLPESPESIQFSLTLFTRTNSRIGVRIGYNDTSSVSRSSFNPNNPIKIIIHGYMSNANEAWVQNISKLFLKKEDCNVVTVQWRNGANKIYPASAANTRVVGAAVAKFLEMVRDKHGAKMETVHVIGHSLGAQTSGYIGQRTPHLGRITGLDPAGPLFERYAEEVRLDPSDAKFVDVIHSDALPIEDAGVGTRKSCGHIDFFPNGGGHQPGCPPPYKTSLEELLSLRFTAAFTSISCSHSRSYFYFAESLVKEPNCQFTAYPCDTYNDFVKGTCNVCGDSPCPVMGNDAIKSSSRRGNYYLITNSQNPFCKNS